MLATPETHGGSRVFWSRRRGRAGCGGNVPRRVRNGRDRRRIPRDGWRRVRQPRREPPKYAITSRRGLGLRGGPRSCSKHFICDAIFIAQDRGIVPLLWGLVRGPSRGEACHMVLDFGAESLPKLQDDVRPLKVARAIDEFSKVVDVFVDGASALVILRRLELRSRRLNLVLRAEVGDEFHHEVG